MIVDLIRLMLFPALMAFAAYKLVTRDFFVATTLPLVASLLMYGGTLVILPRIPGRKKREYPAGSPAGS